MQFAPTGNVYAYFRYDEDDSVMVMFNRSDDTQRVETEQFAERIGDAQNAVDVISGKRYNLKGSITMEPKSVLLLELEE